MAGVEKKEKKPAEHPRYSEMVKAALGALKDRTGSSRQAIEKYIKANYNVKESVASQYLKQALKRMTEKGTILRTKGMGASGSFKLNKAVKEDKPKKKAAKKPAAKKPAAKKPASKKPAAKKPTATKKSAAKSPKKAAKKTKKTAEGKPKKVKKPAAKPAAKKSAKKPAAKKGATKSAKKTPKSPKKK